MIINLRLQIKNCGSMFKTEVCWEMANNHAGQSTTFKSRRFFPFFLFCATTSKVRVYTPLKFPSSKHAGDLTLYTLKDGDAKLNSQRSSIERNFYLPHCRQTWQLQDQGALSIKAY